ALRKVQVGRGASELGLGGGMALLGALLIRRRGRGTIRLGGGFLAALIAGSSGLFLLPYIVSSSHPVVAMLSSGFTEDVASVAGGWAYGNPLLWSALIPVGLTVLFYGNARLRPALAGFGFGIAGALLFAAVSNTIDVRYVPDFLDRFWLLGQAA